MEENHESKELKKKKLLFGVGMVALLVVLYLLAGAVVAWRW